MMGVYYFRLLACCLFIIFCVFEQNLIVFGDINDSEGALNNPCTSIRDCRNFGYICRQGKCQCEQWYIPDKANQRCLGGVDQKCLYDEHCINGAYCMNQAFCKCKHSTSQVLDNGLVCAGAAHLSFDYLLNLTFLAIIVALNS